MLKDRNDSRRSSGADNEQPTDFPSRLAALIGDSSVRAFARKAGVSDTFLRQCLAGRTEPTRTKLIALAGAGGTNVEWLATGNGSRHAILAPAVDDPPAGGLDRSLLESVVAAVEQALGELGHAADPERKALLITALYEMQSGSDGTPISPEEIRRLVARGA